MRPILYCHRCGEELEPGSHAGSAEIPLCDPCYDEHYTTCSDCGDLIHHGDTYYLDANEDTPYCWHCYESGRERRAIQDYYYKPDPLFYGNTNRFFGVELEMDLGGESDHHARSLLELANQPAEFAYCKHDGSLDEGFELVTHPLSLHHHLSIMPWEAVLNRAVSLGYRSHRTSTCGLHVHVNRTTFGSRESEQDNCIARVLYFFEKHWEEFLKFSRRSARQLDRWAARYGYREHPREILKEVKKGYGGCYTCINLSNTDTIEFRIFRGTLKLNTLIATLQLINRVCDVAISCSDDELKELSWTSFVAALKEPELIQYLKERRLYVNEPVATEEEM